MGTLVAKKYPTKLLLNGADHTYVECLTGRKGWSCWGGKHGGSLLRTATGSTRRADAIAEPTERAKVACYLINGVCHQSANRILFPAGVTVDGARGYSLSVAIFGVYGLPSNAFGGCKAPFNQHAGVVGDLAECQSAIASEPAHFAPIDHRPDHSDPAYMSAVLRVYDIAQDRADALFSPQERIELSMALFSLLVQHKLGGPGAMISANLNDELMATRLDVERFRIQIEADFAATQDADRFVSSFNELTVGFQGRLARSLDSIGYRRLLDLDSDDRIMLSDPDIVARIYGGDAGPTETR